MSSKKLLGPLSAVVLCFAVFGLTNAIEQRDDPIIVGGLPFAPTIAPSDDEFIVTGLDFAPDFSKDPFPPYPDLPSASDLKAESSKPINTNNIRPTILYGFEGCDSYASDIIKETYKDFHKLANQPELYKDIDWNAPEAKEFWGATAGRNKIPDDTKNEIRQIYQAAQQVYSNFYLGPDPPHWWWRKLYIHVRCSGGDELGDPKNVCGDKRDQPPSCPPGQPTPPPGEETNMEAYSDNAGKGTNLWYSRITFCSRFFNNLQSLDDAIKNAKSKPSKQQDVLEIWNNRARCFFHEVTHLDYFMNSDKNPPLSPVTDDLQIRYKDAGVADWHDAYGPYNIKVLRNYRGDGYYPQRNADSFAYFALAQYVKKEIGRYPYLPQVGSTKPLEAPKNRFRKPITDSSTDVGVGEDLLGTQDIAPEHAPGFTVPKCGDRDPSTDTAGNIVAALNGGRPLDPKCDDNNSPSGVPYKTFSSSENKVYEYFCNLAYGNKRTLKWNFDSKGTLKRTVALKEKARRSENGPRMRIDKRTPPANPDSYSSFNFELIWEPMNNIDRDKCLHTCEEAYEALATSPCGHVGAEGNNMALQGSVDVGCGTFSYVISGPDVPKAPPPPTQPSPSPVPSAAPPPAPSPTCSVSGGGDGGGDPFDTGGPHTCTCELDGRTCQYQSDEMDSTGQVCKTGCTP